MSALGFFPIGPGQAELGVVNGSLVIKLPGAVEFTPLVPATVTPQQAGSMPAAAFSGLPGPGTVLTDATVSINPKTDQASAYVLQAGTLTADRTLTVANGGTPVLGDLCYITVQPQTHTFSIVNDQGAIETVTARAKTYIVVCYCNGTRFVQNTQYWGNT